MSGCNSPPVLRPIRTTAALPRTAAPPPRVGIPEWSRRVSPSLTDGTAILSEDMGGRVSAKRWPGRVQWRHFRRSEPDTPTLSTTTHVFEKLLHVALGPSRFDRVLKLIKPMQLLKHLGRFGGSGARILPQHFLKGFVKKPSRHFIVSARLVKAAGGRRQVVTTCPAVPRQVH